MLDPSSSEEEGDDVPEVVRDNWVVAPKTTGEARLLPGRVAEGQGGSTGLQTWGRASHGGERPCSPSPSVDSDKEKEDLENIQREEEERKKRLQLYVFVMRCIAYPFNAKQPTDMARRQQKVRYKLRKLNKSDPEAGFQINSSLHWVFQRMLRQLLLPLSLSLSLFL